MSKHAMTASPLTSQLKQSVEGLWLPSETEAPWTVPTWQLQQGHDAELRQVLRREEEAPVVEISLEALMTQVQRRCQAYGQEGQTIAERHKTLFEWLQQQCDRLRVVRVGMVTVDIVIVGAIGDEYIALQTQSVET